MNCSCGTPTRDDAYVCDACLTDLARTLGEIPWIIEQLDITLAKARGVDYTTLGDAGSNESPLPVDQRALEASATLRHALVTWIRFCVEEQIRHQSPNNDMPADNLVAMSAWLLWRVDGLGLNDLGSDAATEITRAVTRCRRVIDRPAEKEYAGPCECGRDMYAKPKAKITKCQGCEREYDVDEMRAWMQETMHGKLVTAREATVLLGRFGLPTQQKTIDKWHERGRVLSHGCSAEGHLVYRIDDLIQVAARSA